MLRPRDGIAFAFAILGFALAFTPIASAQDYVGQVVWGKRGNGPGEFVNPYDVELDESGQVYVSDFGNQRIQVFDRDGRFLRMWGSYGGAAGQFYGPASLVFGPDGLLYVGDLLNRRVQVFTRLGAYVREFRTLAGGTDTSELQPHGVAVAPDGRVFIAPAGTHGIGVYANDGTWLAEWSKAWLPACLVHSAIGIALDASGNLFVADEEGEVCMYDSGGACVRRWECDYPWGVAIGPTGLVFVATGIDVRVFTPTGAPVTRISSSGFGPWEVNGAEGVAVTAGGEVYVVDSGNHRIQRWGPVPTPAQATSWGRLKTYYR